jgi:FSR family fosmidomycin resistance protein-like MFS transporter
VHVDEPAATQSHQTAYAVLGAISFCHFLNDMMQSLLPAIYPILKENYGLDFGQIGLLTFTFQVTASLLQPAVGLYTDRRPQPYSLSMGMGSKLIGLLAAFLPDLRPRDTHKVVSPRTPSV